MGASVSAPSRPTASGVPVAMLSRRGDEQLAGLVAQGNQQAFAVLYERYHQQLYRYCRSILHHDVDAQDALQSAMTAALAALQRDRRLAPVRPWLYRIAHNEVISLLRRRTTVGGSTRVTESLSASAEEEAGERARFAGLMADLAELPERQRAALLMRELSGLPHAEIAIALQTSEGAAKQAIFDARRALLEFAQGRAMECDGVRLAVSDGDGRVLRGRTMRAHLRDCASCQAFAASIPARRAELHAVVPLLAAPASAKLLSRVLAASSGHGAAAGAGATVWAGTPAAAGVAGTEGSGSALITLGAGKAVATTIATKVAAGALIIATGFAGVAAVTSLLPSPAKQTGVTTRHRGPDRGARGRATIGNHPGLAARAGAVIATRSAPSRGGVTASGGGSTATTGGSSANGAGSGTPLAGGAGGSGGTAGPAAGTAATGNGGGTGAGGTGHATTTIASGSGGSTGSTGSGTVSVPAHGHGHAGGQGHGSGGLGPPSRSTSGGSGKTSPGGAGGSGAGGSDGHGNSGHTGTTKPAPPNGGGSTSSSAGTQPVTMTTGTSTTESKPHGK